MKKLITLKLTLCLAITFQSSVAQDTPDEEDIFVLSPFVVESDGSDGYLEERTATGSVIAMDRVDIPMDTTIIGENLIEEMALYNADDLGQVVAGVKNTESVNTSGGGGNTVYTLRGFRSVPFRNGFKPGGRLYDMTSVARVEVVKGPNSLLYGQTDPGGIINYIPKRPLFENRTTLTASFGSYDSKRLMADTSGPIGNSKKLAFRVPASFSENGNDLDFYNNKRTVIAPSLLYRISDKTEIFIETEYLKQEVNLADNAPWWIRDANGNLVTDYHRRGLGRSFNERGPNTNSTNEQFNVTGTITSQIGEYLHLRAMYTYNERESEIQNVVPGNNANRRILLGQGYPAFMSFPYNRVNGYKLDALYDRTFAGIRTNTLLGFEYNHNKFGVSRYDSTSRLAALPNPLNGETLNESDWTWTLGNPFDNPENFRIRNGHPTWNEAKWINIRLTETVYALDDKLIMLGGLAYGEVKRILKDVQTDPSQNDLTHMLGVTYKFTPAVAGFFNTTKSFAPVYRTDLNDRPLDPTTGKGFETGLKITLMDNKVYGTVTYFNITNEGLPRQVPESESPTGESYWINSGEEEAKGFEAEIFWKINNQLDFYLSYLDLDAKLVSSVSNIGTPGQAIPRVPQKAGQFTIKYKMPKDSSLKGLRFGVTGSFADSASLQGNYNNPTLRSDDYFIWNCFVRYKLPTELNTELFLNLKNITDEEYIRPNGLYGDLRMAIGGIQIKF